MTAIRQITTVKADGTVEVRNAGLPAGEEVEVIVLLPSKKDNGEAEPYAFLQVLERAQLEGPPDWSENLEEYLCSVRCDATKGDLGGAYLRRTF